MVFARLLRISSLPMLALPALAQQPADALRLVSATRTNSVVHKCRGAYYDISQGQMGLILGEAIGLGTFLRYWQFGFAVSKNGRRSLQFFAADGEAIRKIYLTEAGNGTAYDPLVARLRSADQRTTLTTVPAAPAADNRIGAAESRVVQKPNTDEMKTSLELFNNQGRNLPLMFGKRKPGISEQESWRQLVAAL